MTTTHRIPNRLVPALFLGGALSLGLALNVNAQGPLAADTKADVPTAEEMEEAGELFASSCSACHLAPDPDNWMDQAWLEQVQDTA